MTHARFIIHGDGVKRASNGPVSVSDHGMQANEKSGKGNACDGIAVSTHGKKLDSKTNAKTEQGNLRLNI